LRVQAADRAARFAARANRANAALRLSSTILRKASCSTTEEEDFENFANYLWLYRTWMPMLRRRDLL
jgi:hypothetical protein